jgi:hypothetical protein
MNNPIPKTFLVVDSGNWASSKESFKDALAKLRTISSRNDGVHVFYLVLNDATAELDKNAMILREPGSELIQIAKFNRRPKLEEFTT